VYGDTVVQELLAQGGGSRTSSGDFDEDVSYTVGMEYKFTQFFIMEFRNTSS